MKNLRIAKKNPSKILKIIDIQPATYRYNTNNQQISVSFRAQPASHSKQYKNIESHRQRSPSRSQRIIDVKANPKNKKIRNRSLGSSQEALKNEANSSSLLKFRNSHEIRSKKDHSPYIRRSKFRESEKLLNFHSVSLGDKVRKEEKAGEREPLKNGTKRRSVLLKADHIEDIDEQRAHSEIIDNAKKFLGQGEYRKSLLVVKNVLLSNPTHIEALYLSAVNWYHLEDRVKTILFLQQIFALNFSYSPECFKMAAVCYSKALEYNKSLACLANCHKCFPEEIESYDLEGRILGKMQKWQQAAKIYQHGYEISKNISFLVNKAHCYEQLNQTTLALQCYEQVLSQNQVTLKVALRKMRLNLKLRQYEEIIHTYDQFACMRDEKPSKQRDQFYNIVSYCYYKLHKFSFALVTLDQGLDNCISAVKFHKILLMIRIHQRDIYEAYHLVSTIRVQPQIRVIVKFIEGVINLMRRNHQQGVDGLLSIQAELGFRLEFTNSIGRELQEKGEEVQDEFLNEIRRVYLMFLSYGYYSISQFHICRKLFKIQKMISVPEYFQLGFQYNFQMCEGIINHCEKNFLQAEAHFQRASTMYDNKLEPHFSLALNCLQIMVNAQNAEQKSKHASRARQYFQVCQRIVGKQASNTAAGVYYFSSLLQAYMQEWKDALDCIDQSIQRSQDHYWRYFYVRGLLLSCIHSFRQAVNDLSLAIALSGTTRPECYLLRSKCLQIEGEGNQAFKDLQEYISLKPDDPDVHKFAGQLLFQNGAFEDALVAFSHQPIHLIPENYDIFLTKGKSLFLLGRFKEAYEVILIAQDLRYSSQVEFDLKVLSLLDVLVAKSQTVDAILAKLQQIYARKEELGKIFKLSDYHILKAVCCTYQSSFQAAISQFLLAIQQKSNELGQSQEIDESGLIQNKKDISTFTNQMRYNIVLCRLSLGEFQEAAAMYKLIHVDFDQPFYGDFISFKKFISREVESYKKEEVFPSRNKLSNFLQKVKIAIEGKSGAEKVTTMMKLCIPFPKVEPPEIFPTFDSGLLVRLSVLNVERKPQAPWVLRENNSIKFTDKIETFSRFQLQDSENDSSSAYQIASIDQSHISPSQRSQRLRTSQHRRSQKPGRISRLEK